MAELTDHELLTRFARNGEEAAFATLVTRHVNLVWSAARRFTGDDTLASEVTQAVFIILAQKAGGISAKTVVTGWLYQTARLTAANALKENRRRQQREHQAYMEAKFCEDDLSRHSGATAEAWQQLAPVLDEAMHALRTADHDAVLLRYFENKSLADVGAALGVTEDAARVRVNRALDKLRALLAKQGIKFGATAIATAVAANAVSAAPAALAASITTAVLTGTSLTLTTVAMTTLQKIAVTAALTVTIGGGLFAAKQAHDAQNAVRTLQAQQAPMAEQLRQMSAQHDKDTNMIAWLQDELAKNGKNNLELLKLRGEIGLLRNKADALSKTNQDLQKQFANDGKISPDASTNAAAVFQVHVKARFVSVPKGTMAGLPTFMGSPSAAGKSFTTILNHQSFTNLYSQISRRQDVEVLGAPEVTTLSGRQTQMSITKSITVITNVALLETDGMVSTNYESTQVQTGPTLDITPRVLQDGSTIALPVIASLTDFLGYATPASTVPAFTKNGVQVDLPVMSPQFSVRESTTTANVFDDQTLVLKLEDKTTPSDDSLQSLRGAEAKASTGDVLVFVTATIIDSAGNRVNQSLEFEAIPDQSPAVRSNSSLKPDATNPVQMFTRTFTVGTNGFVLNLKKAAGAGDDDMIQTTLVKYLATKGITFEPAASLYWLDASGKIVVRASEDSINQIEKVIIGLNNEAK